MKNKHVFLNNNGHNKSVFENFCDATSEFEAEDLLEILVNRYWDDSDLIQVTGFLDDVLKEARELNKYKLRAECLHDVLELFKLVRVEDYSIVNIGLTDVVVSFSSREDWFKIDEKFLEIPDSHVMRETFTHERDYTGDRDARYTIEEIDDTDMFAERSNHTYSAVMCCINNANIDFGETYTDIESFNEGEDHRRIYKETE